VSRPSTTPSGPSSRWVPGPRTSRAEVGQSIGWGPRPARRRGRRPRPRPPRSARRAFLGVEDLVVVSSPTGDRSTTKWCLFGIDLRTSTHLRAAGDGRGGGYGSWRGTRNPQPAVYKTGADRPGRAGPCCPCRSGQWGRPASPLQSGRVVPGGMTIGMTCLQPIRRPIPYISGARPSRCLGTAAPLGTTQPSASSFIGRNHVAPKQPQREPPLVAQSIHPVRVMRAPIKDGGRASTGRSKRSLASCSRGRAVVAVPAGIRLVSGAPARGAARPRWGAWSRCGPAAP
jgi:hypothetical protein